MAHENFGAGVVGGVYLIDPATGQPYKAVGGGSGGPVAWVDVTGKPTTFTPIVGTAAGTAAEGNDARLSDTRTPTDGSVTDAKVNGSAAINLDKTADSATRVAMTSAERTKLTGVATGATANSSDATLLARANHTGTQAISTVTGLQTALDGKQATGAYVVTTDSRLSDARTPTAHAHAASDVTSGTLDIARIPTGVTATSVAVGNDARLSDARTPTAHTHLISQISDSGAGGRAVLAGADAAAIRTTIGAGTSSLVIGTTGTTAAAGNDSRLSDARTPTAHTHPASDVASGTLAVARVDTMFPVWLAQASDGTWPSASGIESTRGVSWRGYPGRTDPPATTGRPAAVPVLDEYVLKV